MISSFSVCGFRGCDESHFRFTENTAIIGANGSGKTHILEAIHIASGGQFSYIQAPREQEKTIALELNYQNTIGEKSYKFVRENGKDIYLIQGNRVTKAKYYEELEYRTIFISPFDMNLFYFAPSLRRDYIDSILTRTFAQFSKVKREYDESLRQRNAFLKKVRDGEGEKRDLDYWDRIFIEKLETIRLYRRKWCDFMEEHIHTMQVFLPKYTLSFHYDENIERYGGVEKLGEYLMKNRDRDILTGHTHIGPHLDDFRFLIDSLESHLFLSRGENKVLLIGLKQLEICFIKRYLSLPIVLLFDDIFAELDISYAERVVELLDIEQVILTSQRNLPKSQKWADFSCINLKNE